MINLGRDGAQEREGFNSINKSFSSLFYEILSGELKRFLVDVPYNSISQFYEIFEQEKVHERFGVSCVWQSYELGRRLVDKGICDVSYYVDGRHIALICSVDGEEYLLDPYLLHTVPIQIFRNYHSSENDYLVRESYAYPYRQIGTKNSYPAKLVTKYCARSGEISLIYKKYSPTKQHYIVSRMFKMDINKPIASKPPEVETIKPLLHHGEQNNLSLRIVHNKTHFMYELIYPIALYHGSAILPENLIARDNRGRMITSDNVEEFKYIENKIVESLGCTHDDLHSFILGGVEIYENHAPENINYAKFEIKDE